MKLSTKHLVASAALAVTSIGASAAPLTELFYSEAAGWQAPTFFDNSNGLNYVGTIGPDLSIANPEHSANTFSGFNWRGTPDNGARSSINIQSYNNANSVSNSNAAFPFGDTNGNGKWEQGEFWAITRLFQINQVLNGLGGGEVDPLWRASVLGNFRVFLEAAHTTTLLADLNSPTTIEFFETINQAPCNATPNPHGSVCDDTYTVIVQNLGSLGFTHDGINYVVDFGLVPGVGASIFSLDPLAIATAENLNSEFFVTAAWRVVPEPSALALFGIGLLGLGRSLKRRQTKAA